MTGFSINETVMVLDQVRHEPVARGIVKGKAYAIPDRNYDVQLEDQKILIAVPAQQLRPI